MDLAQFERQLVLIKKTIHLVFCFLVTVSVAHASVDMDIGTSDLSSGSYDLDRRVMGTSQQGLANVASIYQEQLVEEDLGNVAEIRQIGAIANNFALIIQSGYNLEAHILQQDGGANAIRLMQVGAGHIANLSQIGGENNVMTVKMLGENAFINASQINGTGNVLNVFLDSRSSLTINQSGNNNSFTTTLAVGVIMEVNQSGPTQ